MVLNHMPKVSVCIPTYNYAHFLKDAIDSVLAQTYRDFELLIIDNCSTDDTEEVAARYALVDDRISYFCNESNIGLTGNLNRCLEYATGEYVKILCADDLIEPDCIEKSVRILDDNANVALVYCTRQLVTINLQPIGTLSYADDNVIVGGSEVINACLLQGNIIGEPTAVLFRKSCAKRGFDPRYRQYVDLEMWLYILEQGTFAYIADILCKFRQHDGQGTHNNIRSLEFYDDAFLMFSDYFGKSYVTATFVQKQMSKFLIAYLVCTCDSGYSSGKLLAKIGEHYNIPLFISLLMVKKIKDVVLV